MQGEYERPKSKLKVFLETADGAGQTMSLFLHHGEKLLNLINGQSAFIEVENDQGETTLLAKSFICRLTPLGDGKAQSREKTSGGAAGGDKWRHHSQDPYIVLGIQMNATDDQVREAYHNLARAYHPDKLMGLDLPESMIEHGSTIFQKVNAAYKTIMEQRRKASAA